jgi:hypothetical protein
MKMMPKWLIRVTACPFTLKDSGHKSLKKTGNLLIPYILDNARLHGMMEGAGLDMLLEALNSNDTNFFI